MERRVQNGPKIMWIMKSLLAAYVVSGILLVALAMLLYKFELDESLVSAGIVAVYVISTLVGGFLLGRFAKVRRFLWGMGLGILYFALLLLISLGVYRTLNGDGQNVLTTFLLCAGGGMAGGMLS